MINPRGLEVSHITHARLPTIFYPQRTNVRLNVPAASRSEINISLNI
jgi:hypothetical protein